jgi:hypothetical protein
MSELTNSETLVRTKTRFCRVSPDEVLVIEKSKVFNVEPGRTLVRLLISDEPEALVIARADHGASAGVIARMMAMTQIKKWAIHAGLKNE